MAYQSFEDSCSYSWDPRSPDYIDPNEKANDLIDNGNFAELLNLLSNLKESLEEGHYTLNQTSKIKEQIAYIEGVLSESEQPNEDEDEDEDCECDGCECDGCTECHCRG